VEHSEQCHLRNREAQRKHKPVDDLHGHTTLTVHHHKPLFLLQDKTSHVENKTQTEDNRDKHVKKIMNEMDKTYKYHHEQHASYIQFTLLSYL
jgi:hypothetical protein